MRRSSTSLIICALAGLPLTAAACAAHPAATADVARHRATASATTAALPTPPATSATAAASPPTAATVPGVVADCTSTASLSVRPADISLACADNGLGVEKMTWTTWTTATAAGRGTFWEKLCQPNCADGKIGYYPVTVALSAVKTSAQGRWFSTLTVTWVGTRPPASTPDSYKLTPPGG